MIRLKDRAAIVTGASSGVGWGITKKFCEEGAKIVACARRVDRIQALKEECIKLGFEGEILPVSCDVGIESDLDKVVKVCMDTYGRIDILANIAMALGGMSKLEEAPLSVVDEMYKTGPVASLLLMQKCFPYMKANNYGRIINCSSPSASEGAVVQGPYIMAKCAIEGLTRAAAKEWGQYGITTNVFLPTLWTENFDKSERGKAYAKMMAEQNPVRKFGKPYEDGSPVITFLASEEAGYINGQAICVDGGRCLIY